MTMSSPQEVKPFSTTATTTDTTTNFEDKKWDIIKTNNGKQRISQACDRCCIKKIKCDGLPGGCSNCLKIGFFCKTTDKATRSSFPKGYTKTLERQVIELELENSKIRQELENAQKNNVSSATGGTGSASATNGTGSDSADKQQQQQQTTTISSMTANPISVVDDDDFFNFAKDFLQNDDLMNHTLNDSSSSTNANNFLVIKQELNGDCLKFDQLKTNPLLDWLKADFGYNSIEITGAQKITTTTTTEKNLDFNTLLIKYIKPLLKKNPLAKECILNDNKMDSLIKRFFNNFNKLIPILDFKTFCNQYLNFFNKYDIENIDDDDSTKHIKFQFNTADKNFLLKLLLIIKFNFNNNSIFNNEQNEFGYTIFPFMIFQKLISQCDFTRLTIDNFEIILLLLSYIYNFEIPNNTADNWCYELLSLGLHYINSMGLNVNTDSLVINNNKASSSTGPADESLAAISTASVSSSDEIIDPISISTTSTTTTSNNSNVIQYNFIRLKLYWSFRILLRSIKIEFNYTFKNLKMMQEFSKPDQLCKYEFLEPNLWLTQELLNLIKLIPINFMEMDQMNKDTVSLELDTWFTSFNDKVSLKKQQQVQQQQETEQDSIKDDDDEFCIEQLLNLYYHYKFIIDKKSGASLLLDNSYKTIDLLLTFKIKPKINRGRKKRNYYEMLEQKPDLILLQKKPTLVKTMELELNSLSLYQKLKVNEKLSSFISTRFINSTLFAMLYESQHGGHVKYEKLHHMMRLGLRNTSHLQSFIMEKLSIHFKESELKKTIDISKEFNDLHDTFILPENVNDGAVAAAVTSSASAIIVPPLSPTTTSSLSGSEFSFQNMSRNSSISTNGSHFMSRTPSLMVVPGNGTGGIDSNDSDCTNNVEVKLEVESLFNHTKYHSPTQQQHTHSSSFSGPITSYSMSSNSSSSQTPSQIQINGRGRGQSQPQLYTQKSNHHHQHHHHHHQSMHSQHQRQNSSSSSTIGGTGTGHTQMFRDDEDLLRLKQRVLNMSK